MLFRSTRRCADKIIRLLPEGSQPRSKRINQGIGQFLSWVESQLNVSEVIASPNPAFKGLPHTRWLSGSDQHASSQPQGYDPLTKSEKSEAAGASNNTTSGNMISGNACFMGGSYYNVRGNAHFSSLFQSSSGAPDSLSPTSSILKLKPCVFIFSFRI